MPCIRSARATPPQQTHICIIIKLIFDVHHEAYATHTCTCTNIIIKNEPSGTHIALGIRVGPGIQKQTSTVCAATLNGQKQCRVSVLNAKSHMQPENVNVAAAKNTNSSINSRRDKSVTQLTTRLPPTTLTSNFFINCKSIQTTNGNDKTGNGQYSTVVHKPNSV
jgi:hypothetical protein